MGLIKLTVAFGGAKHEIEHLSPGLRVSELKAQLEPLTGLPPPHMRLIVKGKEAPDHSSLADLNIAHGAKLMLLRNAGGSSATSRPAPPHAPPSSLPPSLAPPDPPVAKEQKQTPIVYGEGSVQLSVVQGRQQHALLCEEATTVTELKGLLHSSCGVHPSQQRLLFKGKEIRAAQTVAELGLAGGGKLMLLFRERHHLEAEGKEAVRAGGEELSSLEQQWSSLQRKLTKRLLDPAEAMTELHSLKALLEGLAQDLRNAHLPESEQERREGQLALIDNMLEELGHQKDRFLASELEIQRQR